LFPDIELVSGTLVVCGQDNKTDKTSTTTTATTDKQMISQNAASVTSSSISAIPLEKQNILGISVEPTSGVRGVIVKTVSPGSPCEGVLKPGDTIFAFDLIGQEDSRAGGAKVNVNNFQSEVSKIQPGMTVKKILNLRSIRQVSCTIPANTQPATPPASSATSPK
jgi:PDZ domain-containing secreted protein